MWATHRDEMCTLTVNVSKCLCVFDICVLKCLSPPELRATAPLCHRHVFSLQQPNTLG